MASNRENEELNSCRICCIIRNPVTELARKVLEDEYKSSTYCTGPPAGQGCPLQLDANFLQDAKKKVMKFEKNIMAGQNYTEWDYSLLCNVIVNTLLPNTLQQQPNTAAKEKALTEIRRIRNEWYGHCPNFYTTDSQLANFHKDLIPHVKTLSPSDDTFKDKIDDEMKRVSFGTSQADEMKRSWKLDRLLWEIQCQGSEDEERHEEILELIQKMHQENIGLSDDMNGKITEIFEKQQNAIDLIMQLTDIVKACITAALEKPGCNAPDRRQEQPKLADVLRRLMPVASKWKSIGSFLEISEGELNNIEHDYFKADDCLREMISSWLKIVEPPPTWKALYKAVEPFNPEIAEEIKATYLSQ